MRSYIYQIPQWRSMLHIWDLDDRISNAPRRISRDIVFLGASFKVLNAVIRNSPLDVVSSLNDDAELQRLPFFGVPADFGFLYVCFSKQTWFS